MLKPSLLVYSVWMGLCAGGLIICIGLTIQLDSATSRFGVSNNNVMFRYVNLVLSPDISTMFQMMQSMITWKCK